MKINFLLLTIITATITSCSTSYKTGQTPDDVYYSPVRLQNDNVRRDEDKTVNDNQVYTTTEDRNIRRRVHNRRYRRYDDRYDYPYGYNNGYNSYPPVYGNPKSGTPQNTQQPRKTNLGAYAPNTSVPDSSKSTYSKFGNLNTGTTTNTAPASSSSNNGSAVGNLIRRVFSGNNNSSSNNSYNPGNSNSSSPSRTFDTKSSSNNSSGNSSNNSGNSNNSSGKSSSTSAPVRTFK
ncbi:MAG: hypothetical protein JWN83_951 [Chitinophagaceae bacterium]|nr:hypothetical protein [Chitinophagaceae bacterium]